MNYRQAELKDLADVAKLVTLEFAGEIAQEMPYLKEQGNPNKFLVVWNQCINLDTHNIFVCYEGDTLLGAIGGYVINQTYSDHPLYGVEDFWFVKKQYRSKHGIGGKLYKMLEAWFKQIGADKIQMMHYPYAPKLKDFYEGQGFKILETTYIKSLKTVEDASFEDVLESVSDPVNMDIEPSVNGQQEEEYINGP
jgi:ribosomal protein S18 acetylase RimI-like enzyme|tara:strand:+ start:4515 stop:5096 length:582 start_codon:yes stop_codon:yes gene_type:complete